MTRTQSRVPKLKSKLLVIGVLFFALALLYLNAQESVKVKQRYDDISRTTYYLTLVKHKDIYGNTIKLKYRVMPKGDTVRNFTNKNNVEVAINASTFNMDTFEFTGVTIQDGAIIASKNTPHEYQSILAIKGEDLLVSYDYNVSATAILADGCTDAITAFIPLIKDGILVDDSYFQMHHMPDKHPRQAIAQLKNKDILILTCGGRGIDGEGMTATDVARILEMEDVQFAFMLDGGGSAQTIVGKEMVNKPIDGDGEIERKVPDVIYIQR